MLVNGATFISLFLPWKRHFTVSKGDSPLYQRPGVLAIVTSGSKRRVPTQSTGSIGQPTIELFSGLTLEPVLPVSL